MEQEFATIICDHDPPTPPLGNVRHEPSRLVDQLNRMAVCRFEIAQFRPDVIGHTA